MRRRDLLKGLVAAPIVAGASCLLRPGPGKPTMLIVSPDLKEKAEEILRPRPVTHTAIDTVTSGDILVIRSGNKVVRR